MHSKRHRSALASDEGQAREDFNLKLRSTLKDIMFIDDSRESLNQYNNNNNNNQPNEERLPRKNWKCPPGGGGGGGRRREDLKIFECRK